MADSKPVTKPKTQYGDIPADLSFEEVIQNRAAPPCSLSDFMDYLFYVERNAEPLQFFLWYWDYIQRWSNLLPRQKALSPPWDPEKAIESPSRFIKYSHKRERSLKMNKILAIMEMGSQRASLDDSSSLEDDGQIASTITCPLASPAAILSPTGSVKPPTGSLIVTIQPHRDEVCRITRHYICPTAPRKLRLSPKDREACLRAVQHTTHPTALLPAFLLAEATLRAHSHARFIHWTRRNANHARIRFVLALGTILVTLGFVLDLLLVLSRRDTRWRALCVVLCSAASMISSASSTASRVDPLRKPSLQVFGPANEYGGGQWMAGYEGKGVMSKVFDETVVVQNKALMMWQDRTVFFALLWGGIGAAALMVVSLFLPSGRLYW
ncbi:hypothetical protein F5144DRAFT_605536 [Chaetomium tenue]|uniref:Uncharacterized protein n=1 Tax=Chaetomium tenue TaxID=1854479 RepID=A0ACB7NZH0_9PEZI|nr:hypothetical protein F5144DRAFT_605536 [Chaetomium globosum]